MYVVVACLCVWRVCAQAAPALIARCLCGSISFPLSFSGEVHRNRAVVPRPCGCCNSVLCYPEILAVQSVGSVLEERTLSACSWPGASYRTRSSTNAGPKLIVRHVQVQSRERVSSSNCDRGEQAVVNQACDMRAAGARR